MGPASATVPGEGRAVRVIVPNFRAVTNPAGDVIAFRGSALHGTSASDKDYLVALGITDVIDLRTGSETRSQPDDLPSGMALRLADALADAPNDGATKLVPAHGMDALGASFSHDQVRAITAALGNGRSRAMMLQTYADLVTLPSAHSAYRTLLTLVLDSSRKCVFHCTAGKDRTGWGAALLDTLAGHDDDTVWANYLDSNAAWRATYEPMVSAFATAGGPAEVLEDLLFVAPDYLQHALSVMSARYGSVEDYIVHGLTMSGAQVDALKAKLS